MTLDGTREQVGGGYDRRSRSDERKDAAREELQKWLDGERTMDYLELRNKLKTLTGAKAFGTKFEPSKKSLDAASMVANRGNEDVLLREAVRLVLTARYGHAPEYKARIRQEAATWIWILMNPAQA